MTSSTEVELLRDQLSKKEEEVRNLSSELSQLEWQLQLRVGEEKGTMTCKSFAEEVALASRVSDSTCHNFLLVRPNPYQFPAVAMDNR